MEPLVQPTMDEKAQLLMRVGRAMSALALGHTVQVISQSDASDVLSLSAAESAMEASQHFTHILLSARRARRHGLAVDEQVGAVKLPWPVGQTAKDVLKSPHQGRPESAGDVACAAIQLIKLAGLLPVGAIWADSGVAEQEVVAVNESDIRGYGEALAACLQEATRARLPLKQVDDAEVVLFRAPFAQQEHLAIRIGRPETTKAPLVRVHSSCLTGDVLGSLRCDCGDQLQAALDVMAKEGSGVLVYLNQEGRGIGLANKLLAYKMQDEGLDTVDANEALGFDADERDYAVASAILKQLNIPSVRLLTNNPEKEEALVASGVTVKEVVPLIIPSNPHNSDYLKTKELRCGHRF